MLDLVGQKVCIFGIQGSGKTHFAKSIMRGFKKPTVYGVTADFDNENVYLYRPKDMYGEFDNFVRWFNKEVDNDLLILDEADLFFSSNADLSKYPNFNELILKHRHMGKTVMLISRRPQDIPTKIVGSCRYSIWFKVGDEENINRKLKAIGVFELMEQITYKKYDFVIKPVGEKGYIHEPVS